MALKRQHGKLLGLVDRTTGRRMEHAVWVRCGSAQSWTGESEEHWRAAEICHQDAAADGAARLVCCTCDSDGAETLTVSRTEVLPRDVLPQGGVSDLVSMGNLHGPAMIDNLRLRFSDRSGPKSIYTYCGHICIAVNPYEHLRHLYTAETQACFHGASFGDNPPHLYAIAEAAFTQMCASSVRAQHSVAATTRLE